MMLGHYVTYEGAVYQLAQWNDVPAAHAGGPSHINYGLAPLADRARRVYVQDPPRGAIAMLRPCATCDAAAGFPCRDGCAAGTAARA